MTKERREKIKEKVYGILTNPFGSVAYPTYNMSNMAATLGDLNRTAIFFPLAAAFSVASFFFAVYDLLKTPAGKRSNKQIGTFFLALARAAVATTALILCFVAPVIFAFTWMYFMVGIGAITALYHIGGVIANIGFLFTAKTNTERYKHTADLVRHLIMAIVLSAFVILIALSLFTPAPLIIATVATAVGIIGMVLGFVLGAVSRKLQAELTPLPATENLAASTPGLSMQSTVELSQRSSLRSEQDSAVKNDDTEESITKNIHAENDTATPAVNTGSMIKSLQSVQPQNNSSSQHILATSDRSTEKRVNNNRPPPKEDVPHTSVSTLDQAGITLSEQKRALPSLSKDSQSMFNKTSSSHSAGIISKRSGENPNSFFHPPTPTPKPEPERPRSMGKKGENPQDPPVENSSKYYQ